MTLYEWITTLKAEVAVGGFSGGVVALAIVTAKTLLEGFITVFAGLVSAVFLTPFVDRFVAIPESMYGGVGFLIGLGAMPLTRSIYRVIARKSYEHERELLRKSDNRIKEE